MSNPDDAGNLSLGSSVASPPPDQLILRDETGQPWAVTVHPDGQLQTARYPDGGVAECVRRGADNKGDFITTLASRTLAESPDRLDQTSISGRK